MNNNETEPEPITTTKTGYIYALLHANYIYIGSTTNLKKRYSKHKSSYKNSNKNLYQIIRNIADFDIFNFITIEKIEFNNISELRKLEQYYINLHKNNDYFTILNKNECFLDIPNISKKEYEKIYYKTDKRNEYIKNYYINNKSKFLERAKQQHINKKLP